MSTSPANQDNSLDRPVEIIVLAAGQGTRMRSTLPKVLHPIGGRPMLAHVLDTVSALHPSRVHLVVGHGADEVRRGLGTAPGPAAEAGPELNWVVQAERKGTAHAVAQALPHVSDAAIVLVTYGDVPLVRPEILRDCVRRAADGALALVTAEFDDPAQLGRIVRDAGGGIRAIVEHADASDEVRRIREINSGILALDGTLMKEMVARIQPHNAQGEYYLTDLVALAVTRNLPVAGLPVSDPTEVMGINDRGQLAEAERALQQRLADALMRGGVSVADPGRLDVRGVVSAGEDCFIDINVVLEGEVRLGRNVRIGPGCVIRNTSLADDVVVEAHTVVDGAAVAARCTLGPFARIRPGTVLGEDVKIGNFVETKNARLGRGTKASHLTYLGDATLGEDCNVGAGTVTCNYDGIDKHPTVIGDQVFVGTNSTLVAPIEIGSEAFVAAGSTVTVSVPEGGLAVGRGKQRNIEGWTRPDRRKKKDVSHD